MCTTQLSECTLIFILNKLKFESSIKGTTQCKIPLHVPFYEKKLKQYGSVQIGVTKNVVYRVLPTLSTIISILLP